MSRAGASESKPFTVPGDLDDIDCGELTAERQKRIPINATRSETFIAGFDYVAAFQNRQRLHGAPSCTFPNALLAGSAAKREQSSPARK